MRSITAGPSLLAIPRRTPVGVVLREDGDAELDGLFVEPSHWRQGIGWTLVVYVARRRGRRRSAADGEAKARRGIATR